MLRFNSLLFAVFYFSALACCSQHLLFHKNQNKEVLYTVGDVISFSTKEDHSRKRSRILGFQGDTLIVFPNYTINPASITTMYVDEKTMGWFFPRYQLDEILIYLGIGYTALELVNESIINGNPVDRDQLLIGAVIISLGYLARWLISKKIKIKGRTKLLIIDPT